MDSSKEQRFMPDEVSGHDASKDKGSSGLSSRQALIAASALATLATLFLGYFVGDLRGNPPVDSNWYRGMADGQNAIKPFANRVLGPLLAQTLGHFTHTSSDTGFFLVGLASIWIAVCGVLAPILRGKQASGMACAVFLMYFWVGSYQDYFLPDLLHAALLVLFFTALRRRWWVPAALLLLPLYLARESTLLLSLIAVPILWKLLSRRMGLLFLGTSLAGIGFSRFVSRHGLPNIHGLNDTLYMIGKIPWNLSKNVFGVVPWTNTDATQVPAHIWNLPAWIHLGRIHQVGYGQPSGTAPLITLFALLLVFGLGPCCLLALLFRVRVRQLLPRNEPWLWVAAIYGGISYLLAPALGTGLFRLAGYGWPLFLLYLPAMLPRVWMRWHPWQVVGLLAAHLVPYWLWMSAARPAPSLQLAIVLAADALGLVLLLRARTLHSPAYRKEWDTKAEGYDDHGDH